MARKPQYVKPRQPQEFLPLQHPRLVAKPPTGQRWVHEIKFDGYRVQPHVHGGQATIFTRRGHDWTAKFPELAVDLARLPDCILDCELCAVDARGQPDFAGLQAAIAKRRTSSLVLFVFDVLWGKGEDARPYSLDGRRHILTSVLEDADERIREVEQFEENGAALFASAAALGLEGIISKDRSAAYVAGKGQAWTKAKTRPSQELVVVGFRQDPHGPFRGLLTAVHEGGKLVYAGSIGTGFGKHPNLLSRLRELEIEASPLAPGRGPSNLKGVHWVRPELVAAADIAEWTSAGKVRQASFKGLREDKRPEDVVRERPGAAAI